MLWLLQSALLLIPLLEAGVKLSLKNNIPLVCLHMTLTVNGALKKARFINDKLTYCIWKSGNKKPEIEREKLFINKFIDFPVSRISLWLQRALAAFSQAVKVLLPYGLTFKDMAFAYVAALSAVPEARLIGHPCPYTESLR
jgi:hypothetical protein